MATESEQAAAIRAFLDAALVGDTKQWHAYDYDDVPQTLPSNYALVTVTRRFGDDLRFSADRQMVGYRLTTLAVGKTVDTARWVRNRVSGAVSDQQLTIGGVTTTRVRFETENPIVPDDGMYSGLTTWTYAL